MNRQDKDYIWTLVIWFALFAILAGMILYLVAQTPPAEVRCETQKVCVG